MATATSASSRRLGAALPALLIAGTVLATGGLTASDSTAPELDTWVSTVDPDNGICPTGYQLVDYARIVTDFTMPTGGTERTVTDPAKMVDPKCMINGFPESPAEMRAAQAGSSLANSSPDWMEAWNQAEALSSPAAQAAVPGISGEWAPYGTGLLSGDEDRFTETAAQGLDDLAGRIDSLVHDEDSGRVFAAGGTSGIWMSEDLGDTWTSIGDTLPSNANGAIAWSPEGGGTLVVISGEPTFGGNLFAGVGAFWTNDLGATWTRADGVPQGAMGFAIEVDRSAPNVVYAATSLGLYRSTDAGRSYVNVALPVSDECAGVSELGTVCDTASVVTDVIVKIPGGSTGETGGEVLAAVGHRNDAKTYPTGEVRSPGQGLYYSATGEPGTFERLDLIASDATNVGFASQERQGRVEFGQASGADQDHNIIYAIVSDPVLMAGGTPTIDIPDGVDQAVPDPRDVAGDVECQLVGLCIGVVPNTALNGLYASIDFGQTWYRMADDAEISDNPATGSALAPIRALIAPGIQAWYNEWIEPDPTSTDPLTGAPTRLLFGLEEIWAGVTQIGVPFNGPAQSGASDFEVVGRYFGAERCAFLDNDTATPGTNPIPYCPTARPFTTTGTTHPDQHDALWIPTGEDGVTLLVANDGGIYKTVLDANERIDNNSWTVSNTGMNTLLPYSVAVSSDGAVYLGLQDNGTAKIDPETGTYDMVYVGDGTYATVDPFDSNLSTASTPGGAFAHTTDGGLSYGSSRGSAGDDSFQFVTPWTMDPVDELHLLTAGTQVHSSTSGTPGSFRAVFDLGSPEEQPEIRNMGTAMAAAGDAEYVGYCGACDVYRNPGFRFLSGIATNINGDEAPFAGEPDGWHHATAAGLPERYVSDLWVNLDDEETVYATLGAYAGRRWAGINTYTDPDRGQNNEGGPVWMSTDAGESFVDISGNLPDVRASWVIQRGQQLLVATDIGVFMSSDMQGTTWAKLAGLPNHPVKQIMMRPDHPNELFAAVYGRSIWRYTFGEAPTQAPAPAPETEPSSTPLPATGGGMVLAGVAALGIATRRRGRRGLIG